jgi:DNA-binding transcriptional ArsR family regulator
MATASNPNTDDLFVALAHPLRRQILRRLIAESCELSPRELAVGLDQSLSKLSYHVRVLAKCGAIKLVRTKQIRGSTQHFYRSTVEEPWARSALQAKDEPPPKGKS